VRPTARERDRRSTAAHHGAHGLLTRENLRGTVWMLDGATVYARLGDWPGMLATLVTVLALALRPRATVRPPAA